MFDNFGTEQGRMTRYHCVGHGNHWAPDNWTLSSALWCYRLLQSAGLHTFLQIHPTARYKNQLFFKNCRTPTPTTSQLEIFSFHILFNCYSRQVILIYCAILLPALTVCFVWRRLHPKLTAPLSDSIPAAMVTSRSFFGSFKIGPLVEYLLAHGDDFQYSWRKARVECTVGTQLL